MKLKLTKIIHFFPFCDIDVIMNSQFSDVQRGHLDGDNMSDRIRSDIFNHY